MSEDFKGLYDVRDSVEADHAFILATFLRGLYYGDSWFSLIPKEIFMTNYKNIAQQIVLSDRVMIKVACLREDPDVILGYSILSDNFQTVHWIYVKSNFRKRGIGKSLMPQFPTTFTHLSALGKSLSSKFPTAVFNPFKIKGANMQFFKGKNKKKVKEAQTNPTPRELPEIQKQFADLTGRAGQLEYQLYVLPKQLKEINEALESLNYEAAARNKLNADAQATSRTVDETKAVSQANQ